MSILIKGMEMPECCGYCPFEHKNYCMAKPSLMVESADRHPRCPLVHIPPHGRLIDADALIAVENRTRTYYPESGGESLIRHYILDYITLEQVKTAPTILEAEVE